MVSFVNYLFLFICNFILSVLSAVSSNHFREIQSLLNTTEKFLPGLFNKYLTKMFIFLGIKLLLYDLGLNEAERNFLKSKTFLIYRQFPFDTLPQYVSKLNEYRWKPLIIEVKFHFLYFQNENFNVHIFNVSNLFSQ
jgi:hypothetical protein